MSSSQNFYTQTCNFVSAISGDVDPRTRLFGFQQTLGTITENNGMGPEIDLTIFYSPTTSTNTFGMGIGVILAVPYIDRAGNTIALSSGESYKFSEDSGVNKPLTILQRKIATFIAVKQTSNNYRITDSNGQIVDLQHVKNDICLPVKIYSPLGYTLDLEWNQDANPIYLKSVTDESGKPLYRATFNTGSVGVEMTFFPDCSESYSIKFSTTNGHLSSIVHSALPDAPWQFNFRDVGMPGLFTLTETITPTGLKKTATYNAGGKTGIMYFSNASMSPLPAVTQLTISPGFQQPDIVTLYGPSGGKFKDYLGFGGKYNAEWSADTDNTYNALDDYQYQTIVSTSMVVDDETTLKQISTYTYNNYHLLLSIEKTQNEASYTVETEYFAVPNATFDAQPNNFQYPSKQTEIWSRPNTLPRREITAFVYDDFGNLTQQTYPDKHVVVNEYYASEEESEDADGQVGCPADPNGFVRLIRSRTIYPAQSEFGDEPVRQTLYRYENLSSRNASVQNPAIVPVQETNLQLSNDQSIKLTVQQIAYFGSSTSTTTPGYGAIQLHTTTTYDQSTPYPRSLHFAYQIEGDAIVRTDTLQTHDLLSLTSTESRSRYTMRLGSVTSALGNVISLEYDLLGRVTKCTRNPGTPYEHIATASYHLPAANDIRPTIFSEFQDGQGNAVKVSSDALMRRIRIERNAPDFDLSDQWFTIGTHDYDAFGRLIKSVSTDYLDVSAPENVLEVVSEFEYDDWNQCHFSHYSSGQDEYSDYDPIAMQLTEWSQSASDDIVLGRQVTSFNVDQSPTRITRLDLAGKAYSENTFAYDGLNRQRTETDAVGNTTRYAYDAFDRTQVQTLPDGTRVTRSYAPFSVAPLPVMISVSNVTAARTLVMGSQTFDGLARATQTTCGGRTVSRVFNGANRVPETTTEQSGALLTYTYISQLRNATQTCTGVGLSQNFEYDDQTGAPTLINEDGSEQEALTWWQSGLLKSGTFTQPQGTYTTAYTWTLRGRPLSFTDVGGAVQTASYDAYGRLASIDDPRVSISYTYDSVGRLATQVAISNDSTDELTTTLTWDEYSREVQRDIAASGAEAQTIAQGYRLNDQIATRTATLGTETLRGETFQYDDRNRLTDYTCVGTTPPVDGYGYPLAAQTFELDIIDNITRYTTTLATGEIDDATCVFANSDDPSQLTGIDHTLPKYPAHIDLTYDENGRMILDEAGRTLEYDCVGRLVQATGASGSSVYGYDGRDTLITQVINGSDTRKLFYRGDQLANELEIEHNRDCRFVTGPLGSAAVVQDSIDTGSPTSRAS